MKKFSHKLGFFVIIPNLLLIYHIYIRIIYNTNIIYNINKIR